MSVRRCEVVVERVACVEMEYERRIREKRMQSLDFIFWEVDVQADFMLPGGSFTFRARRRSCEHSQAYGRSTARRCFSRVARLFSSPHDPEFQQFPPHCVKGTPGAEFVPEALAERFIRVPNDANAKLPEDLSPYQQIILESRLSISLRRVTRTNWSSVWATLPNSWLFGVVTDIA